MSFRRMFVALILAAVLSVVSGTGASADRETQKEKSKDVPEVPLAAALPLTAGAVGAGYYVLARWRARQ